MCSVSPTICEGYSSRADKFETVYKTRTDLSTARYQTKSGKTGTMCYTRSLDVILLVSPTELKVQTGWIDSVTVRFREFRLV